MHAALRHPETMKMAVVPAGFPARHTDGSEDPSARTNPKSSRQRLEAMGYTVTLETEQEAA